MFLHPVFAGRKDFGLRSSCIQALFVSSNTDCSTPSVEPISWVGCGYSRFCSLAGSWGFSQGMCAWIEGFRVTEETGLGFRV